MNFVGFIGKTTCVVLVLAILVIMLACGNVIDKINKLDVECQAGNKESCAKLADYAINDKDHNVRMAAVEKLSDQTLLAKIAKNCKYYDASMAAGDKLEKLNKIKEN